MTILIAAILYILAALLAWAFIRGGTRQPTPHLMRHSGGIVIVDYLCSRCGEPTGWTWFGRPLCVPCRKREIEKAS